MAAVLQLLGGALLLSGIAIFLWLALNWQRLQIESRKVSACGYLAPPTTARWKKLSRRFSKVFCFWQVGPVRIVGEENLYLHEAQIIAPNHGHFVDPVVFPGILQRPARYMAAQGAFQALFGLAGIVFARSGVFSVDLTKGKGGPAKDAAVAVLVSGQQVVMFPEGWAWLDGVVEPFKKGAIRICREASKELGRPLHIVPVYMRYGRYPGSWVRRISPGMAYLILFLAAPFYRAGLTIVCGKPICIDEFAANDEEATRQLREQVIALDPAQAFKSKR